MKLKNYRPLMLRQVEYFGETITIPTDCEWVATDSSGGVMAWGNKPDTQRGYWECSNETGIEIPFFVGEFDPIDKNDAFKTLRHYPIGEQA